MEFLATFHSFWRWVVLIAAVVALVGAIGGWLGSLSPALSARRAGTLYVIALDVQLLTGLILWVGRGWYATPGYFRFEHPLIMLLALVLAHGGQILARRATSPTAAARAVALGVAASLVLVIVGIPGVVRRV